jgi:hypothetical protein
MTPHPAERRDAGQGRARKQAAGSSLSVSLPYEAKVRGGRFPCKDPKKNAGGICFYLAPKKKEVRAGPLFFD